eukprot:13074079-Ditylum_brightwellii.AAC.1
MKSKGFDVSSTVPKVHYKAFEDNSGALELTNTLKLCPRTKHINVMYHHFHDWVRDKCIELYAISG